jgi:serine/threonine protein kinase
MSSGRRPTSAQSFTKYPPHSFTPLTLQILKGVSHLHRHKLIHNDIKPENVLFMTSDPDSPVKITDFNSSSFIPPGASGVEGGGGTVSYMSPEACRRERTTEKSDVVRSPSFFI